MQQVKPYQNYYPTVNDVIDRIGYIRIMIDYLQFNENEKIALERYKEELLDREIELMQHIVKLNNKELTFNTVNFGDVDLDKAYYWCDKMSHTCA